MQRTRWLAAVAVAVLACGPGPRSDTSPAETPVDRDWSLVALGDQANPIGMGSKPVTLRLDSASGRAAGFGGCNRYSGPYTLENDTLTFGPTISTKMACAQGMDVEGAYFAALGGVAGWSIRDDVLTLRGATELRFRAGAPEAP